MNTNKVEPITVHVVKVFEKEEIQSREESFSGDYLEVRIFVEGRLAATYGDAYHDKGREKAVGFIEGMGYILSQTGMTLKVTHHYALSTDPVATSLTLPENLT